MIVVALTNCPPRLRGDLTKWLVELNAGVYVGNVSARVREELWQRICENVHNGRATMVFGAQNEQGLDFHVHNTTWIPTDFDGIKLMLRPTEAELQEDTPIPLSRASQIQKVKRIRAAEQQKKQMQEYVVVDVETTGLRADQHELIEIAAVHVVDHQMTDTFSMLVHTRQPVPAAITALTGIDDALLCREGQPLEKAMGAFFAFVGERRVICHNAGFDYAFLKTACRKCHLPEFKNPYADTRQLAMRQLDDVPDHKLSTIAEYLSLEAAQAHRALADCIMTFSVFEKLNEIRSAAQQDR